MKIFIFFILFAFMEIMGLTKAWARPKDLEVWFLSIPEEENKSTSLLWRPVWSRDKWVQLDADLDHSQCIEVENEYFHPQHGLHNHNARPRPIGPLFVDESSSNESDNVNDNDSGSSAELQGNGKSWEDNLIQCRDKHHFDFFCEQPVVPVEKEPGPPLEVWVDSSSSFSMVDPTLNGKCKRKEFYKILQKACSDQVLQAKTFTTKVLVPRGEDDFCGYYGLNDTKKLIETIESFQGEKLIIITDIYELESTFVNYIRSIGGRIVGEVPGKRKEAKDLPAFAEDWKKNCALFKGTAVAE